MVKNTISRSSYRTLYSFFCVKPDPFYAFRTRSHPGHDTVYGNGRIVEIRSIIPQCFLGFLFPLTAGHTCVVGVLSPCMSFFIAKIASIGHNNNFQITNPNFQETIIKKYCAP